MEKCFCHKKVKILVLKKEQGKNLYRYITNEKQNKMFAKNDLNSVALNMSTVRPQLNSYDYGLDWHWDFQELTWTMERSSTTFEKMLVTYSFVYFFKLLHLYANFWYLKMTWGGEKIGRFYCWILFHNAYKRNFLLEKVKNYFP